MPDLSNDSKSSVGFSYLVKKFGGAKVVSTILGMLLLAGGVGAGVALVMSPQLFEQRASVNYTVIPSCTNLDCSDSAASGTIVCTNSNGTSGKCCPFGKVASGGQCIDDPNRMINCNGVQCKQNNCHCGDGDICTPSLYVCVDDSFINSCVVNQGRSWCVNYQGNAMTCCVEGYVCANTVYPGEPGCIPGPGGTPKPTRTPGTGTEPTPTPTVPPTRPPVPTPTPTPRVTPTPTPVVTPTPTVKPTVTPTPTATPIAVCTGTTIYTPNWTLISATTFQSLPVGGQVYFCVKGETTAGAFDMARFTINNTLRPEVTLRRPGFSDICDLYTIPSDTYAFTVQGEIHHTTLGWR